MLDNITKRRIDDCRDILVGKLPDPKSQIEQITIGLIYKFMDDMDKEAIELGGSAKFFSGDYEKYSWDNLFDTKVTAAEMLRLYSEAIESMEKNPNIPELFSNIFKNAYLPYRDPETLKMFLKTIAEFEYTHSEKLGDAFEYLLSVMGSQGDAGQFRTPRHIIDFLVAAVNPSKTDSIMDPACGTAGFLISAFKHICRDATHGVFTPDERKKLVKNFVGYDISPDMVRMSLVNLYLHGFPEPHIYEYDTLSSEERWDESFDVILANPPFMSPKGGIRPHKKFSISSNRSEVLFVDYIAEHLNPKGKAGIIVPEGIIFQSGTAYKDLRKMLVDNYLYAVVSLPAGVFNPYSGVKTSILLMDKTIAKRTNDILFIKIDNDGYNLGAQRNPIKGGQLEDAVQLIHEFVKSHSTVETPCMASLSPVASQSSTASLSPVASQSSTASLSPVASPTSMASLRDKTNPIAHLVPKTEIGKSGDYNLSGERYKIKKEINNIYEWKEIGEISQLIKDGDWIESKDQSEFGIRLVQTGNVGIGEYKDKSDKARFISDETFKRLNCTEIFPNDVLISRLPDPVGRACLIPNLNVKLITSVDCSIIRFDTKKIIPKLFVYYTKLDKYYDNIKPYLTGSSRSRISRKNLEKIKIPLPPLSVQEEIVAEIESYQQLIDGAKMVVDNYKPRIEIDPSWEMVELGEIAKLIGGGTPSKQIEEYWENGDIDWISCSDFTSNSIYLPDSIRKITESGLKNSSSNLIEEETLVLVTRVSLGKIAFTKKPTAINQDLTAIAFTDENVNKFFAYYFLLSISNKIEQDGNGVTVKGVSRDYVKSIKIPKPSKETQQQIVSQIENEQKLVNANKELIAIYEQKIKDRIGKVWGEKEKTTTKKLSNDLYLAMMLKQMEKKIQLNYGEVATQKTVFHLNTFTNQKLDYPFINSNYGTYSYQLKDDLVKNPYLLKTKKGSGEVFVVSSSKENEVLEALSNPENKAFVDAINEIIKIYQTPLINKETENIELLNTVLKVILDKQSTDIEVVYDGMKEWKIEQNGFSTKADKFTKAKTKRMIDLIEKLGLIGKLII